MEDWSSFATHPGMPYEAYLDTPAWKHKRTYMLRRAGHRCQVCNGSDRLEVHHRTYARLGAEMPDDLTVLCHACHQLFHTERELKTRRTVSLSAWVTPSTGGAVLCFIAAGWAYSQMALWSTYHEAPYNYLWRFGLFYFFTAAGIWFAWRAQRPRVAGGSVILFALILLAIFLTD